MKKRPIIKALICSLALCTVLSLCGCGGAQETSNSSAQTSSNDVSGTAEDSSQEEYKDPEYTIGKIVDSGKCGDDVYYELDENGLLVISGTGYMYETDRPFYEKSQIKNVIIKTGVTSIGDHAFGKCTSLTSITIPDSVTSIGGSAFSDCTSLTSINIPDSVTSIQRTAFSGCMSLTGINVDKNNKNYSSFDGVLFNKSQNELIICPGGKSGAYTIPDSVTSIGVYAFDKCTSLTSITIPDGVTSIGADAFEDCTSLTGINVDKNNKNYCSFDGVLCNKSQNELIICPVGKSGAYTIPDSVKSIGYGAFYGCTSLTSITIPNSVTSIGADAFSECTSLTSITIPDSVTSIGDCAFYNWTPSQRIYIKGRSSIPIGWEPNWNWLCDAQIVWNA